MRAVKPITLFLVTAVLVWAMDRSWGPKVPALGRLLDPVNGAMATAEETDHDFGGEEVLQGLKAPVQVWYDHRLVPHIRAQNNHDLYFAQGYVHALFRLWQMDLQTRAAGGRVSEVLGPKAVDYDRAQRRKGMMYAAENSLRAMEAEPRTREALDAYRDGINAHIASLSFRTTPLEYKLMGFAPEKWTNIRTALLLKYMADDLTGYTEDIPLTYLRERLSKEDFDLLYPLKIPGSKHVVPEGTPHRRASMAVPPVPGDEDSLFAHFGTTETQRHGEPQPTSLDVGGMFPQQPTTSVVGNPASEAYPLTSLTGHAYETGVGSNSWVISPKLTASGAAILCNDPHLALNLPSLWFEVQLQAPGINCYGVSMPGAPGVIIGFNDSVSWGLTNNYRDVKDYYEIHPADAGHYWFDGAKRPFAKRVERIGVKGGEEVLDTVLYTVHGPVQYDAKNPSPDTSGRMLAMCWMAHRPTNELLAVWKWNRATDVASFRDAIQHFECPAQNIAYADRAGNYAQFTQGRYTNKWPGQGRFVMNGSTSKTLWGADIPMEENPFALNHPQGYLVAANQSTTDDAYPYWYNGSFSEWRSWEINAVLGLERFGGGPRIRIDTTGPFGRDDHKMFSNPVNVVTLQGQEQSSLAFQLEQIIRTDTVLWKKFWEKDFNEREASKDWYGVYAPQSAATTAFHLWWTSFCDAYWRRRFSQFKEMLLPSTEVAVLEIERILKGSQNSDERKALIETFRTASVQYQDSFDRLQKNKAVEWAAFKNTHINHLTKISAFGFGPLKVGGWGTTINANKVNEKGQAYGPSWRMIVEMDKDSIRAYGHYPGGPSGNVGSKWYANMLNDWVEGKYHRLVFFLAGAQPKKEDVMYSLTLKPSGK